MTFKSILLSMIFLASLSVSAADSPKIVNVPLHKAYVPIGFDDNDRVQVTVQGTLPNTCYKVADAGYYVDEARRAIHIFQNAYFYHHLCSPLPVTVSFSQVINVGILRAGNYNLIDGLSGRYLGKLPVIRASHPGPDDYLYAPVDEALFIVNSDGRKYLILAGQFTDRCTELADVQVHYYPDVIVVQPIAKRLAPTCDHEKVRFTKIVELDSSLKGTQLLHVRTMSGQAINKLVDPRAVE